MAGIGTFIMLGVVVGSICISLSLFLDERLVDITEESGDSVIVNNVEFNISYIGNYESLEKTEEYKELEKTQVVKGLATSEIAEGVFSKFKLPHIILVLKL